MQGELVFRNLHEVGVERADILQKNRAQPRPRLTVLLIDCLGNEIGLMREPVQEISIICSASFYQNFYMM